MKVTAILKGSKDAHNRQPVCLRKADGKTRKFRIIKGMRVSKDQFEKGKIKSSHPHYKTWNEIIKAEIDKFQNEEFTPEEKVPETSFYHFCNDFISRIERKRSKDTVRQYSGEVRKMKGFKESVRLSQIDRDWLQDYSDYCYSLGNKDNTLWKTFKFVRMMILQALKEKKISEDPFLFFETPKYKQPETKYLTRDEIDLLDSYVQSKECPAQLAFIGNWFLISCWTALRYSDCRNFDKKKIKSGRIIVYTKKTGTPVSLPFHARLKNLFERVDYKPLHFTNEYCNRMLKVICEAAGIDPHSYHASRHAFGVMAASAGIRRETIQVLMGHNDIKSTAIYARLVPAVVDAELAKMS